MPPSHRWKTEASSGEHTAQARVLLSERVPLLCSYEHSCSVLEYAGVEGGGEEGTKSPSD